MTDSPDPTKILESIITRPGMYWGDSDDHFQSLLSFLSGVEVATNENVPRETKAALARIIPTGFTEFVRKELRTRFPNCGMEWALIIKSKTKTDREALDLLLELRRKFDPPDQGGQPITKKKRSTKKAASR